MERHLSCEKCGSAIEPAVRYCPQCGHARATTAGADVGKQTPHGGTPSAGPRRHTPTSAAYAALLENVRQATFGEYEIKHELGHGGMASVYLAHHFQLNRPVALKVMLPFLALIEGMAQRFRDEARTAARLDHPNIVIIHSVEEREGLLFFAMKFVNGCSLDVALRRGGPLPIHVVQLVLVQVASALHYAHTEGVIHRDVKLSNVMVDRHGTPIVTDFGIAKAAESTKLTQTGSLLGTPVAMSPELWNDRPASPKSDQYALGVLAYELLVGKPPFSGDRFVIREMHLSQAPQPIAELRPDCPPTLAAAIMRMLAKAPDDRWPSLADAIHSLSADLPGELTPVRRHLAAIVVRESGPRLPEEPSFDSPIPTPTFPPRVSKTVRMSALTPTPAPAALGDVPQLANTIFGIPGAASAEPSTGPAPSDSTARPNRQRRILMAATTVALLAVSSWLAWATPWKGDSDPASITFLTPGGSVVVGDSLRLEAVVQSSAGDTLANQSVSWASSDSSVLTVSAAGTVTSHGVGRAEITALVGSAKATTTINVTKAAPNATLALTPAETSLTIGASARLAAVVRDASGATLPGRSVRWRSSDTAVARVDSMSGLVTARAIGSATISAFHESGAQGAATFVVAAMRPTIRISATAKILNVGATTLLTPSLRDSTGTIVQQGVVWSSSDPAVASVDSQGRVVALKLGQVRVTAKALGTSGTADLSITEITRVSAGGDQTCALRSDGAHQCWIGDNGGALVPSPKLQHVATGPTHACGLAEGGDAYCWGSDNDGQLGAGGASAGARANKDVPVRVSGGIRFRSISAGRSHTCAITTDGNLSCWGSNASGQLGIGADRSAVRAPISVAGKEFSIDIAAGAAHSCAVGQSHKAYCWGDNTSGQLGIGSTQPSLTPQVVKGKETYSRVAAGDQHTCGITPEGEILCWGSNKSGQLGNGSNGDRDAPLHVKTAGRDRRLFLDIAAGANHTCALRKDRKVVCWGEGGNGQLGTDVTARATTPLEVSGGLSFKSITAGGNHSCGVAEDGGLYCWGGASGQTGRSRPTRVPGS